MVDRITMFCITGDICNMQEAPPSLFWSLGYLSARADDERTEAVQTQLNRGCAIAERPTIVPRRRGRSAGRESTATRRPAYVPRKTVEAAVDRLGALSRPPQIEPQGMYKT